MIANKTAYKIQQSLNFLLREFIEAVLITFVAIVFVLFVDTISITNTILSPSISSTF